MEEKTIKVILGLVVILEILAVTMIVLGTKNNMLPPTLTGIGFFIISAIAIILINSKNPK